MKLILSSVVVYAAKIGSCGIDTHSFKSRADLWLENHESLSLINTLIPWYPKVAGYDVCEIVAGKRIVHVFILYVTVDKTIIQE